MAWRLMVLGIVLLLPSLTLAQAEIQCGSLLKEAELKLNAKMLQERTMLDAFARELRVAVERAERAEQAQARLQQELQRAKPPAEKHEEQR